MDENEISEFVAKSIEQVKSGLPEDCDLAGNFDFEISVITTKSKDGKIGIHLANMGGRSETKQIHKIRFPIIDKKSRENNTEYAVKFLKDLISEYKEMDEIQE